jgi:hypothetical protein
VAKSQLDGTTPVQALAAAGTPQTGTTTAPVVPTVTQSGDVAATLTAIRGELVDLRTEQRAANVAIAKNTAKTTDVVTRWDYDGMPAVRV